MGKVWRWGSRPIGVKATGSQLGDGDSCSPGESTRGCSWAAAAHGRGLGLLSAKAERCTGADRRDEGRPGVAQPMVMERGTWGGRTHMRT
jgi:hypothetical protein